MGNHKFRLSDMIPNAWFYKLKEMGTKPTTTTTTTTSFLNNSNSNSINSKEKKKKKTKQTQAYSATTPPPIPRHFEPQIEYDHHYLSRPRKSYHFTRKLVNKKCPNSPPPSPPLHHHHHHDHDQTQHHTLVDPPPRKSSRKRRPRKPNLSTSTSSSSPSSASAGWSCRAVTATATTVHSFRPTPTKTESPISNLLEIPSDCLPYSSTLLSSGEGRCSCHSDRRDDTIIDVDQNSLANKSQQNNNDDHQIGSGSGSTAAAATTTCTLPPIKTEHYNTAPRQLIDNDPKNSFKQAIPKNPSLKKPVALKRREEDHSSVAVAVAALPRRFSSSSAAAAAAAGGSPGGIRLRVNSPRIARITPGITGRGSRRASSSSKPIISSESLAVVKSSSDPQKDFRDSMVEMILENKINTSKGLEDLLACYLSLNADEYHHLIVNVFKQIWFDLKTNNTTATNTTPASATKLIRRRTTRRGSPYQLQLVA